MADTLILIFFALLFAGIIGFVLGNQLMKYLKGSLKLVIPRPSYMYGESIDMMLHFQAKKDIKSYLLELSLVAYRWEHRSTKKGKTSRQVELFRTTQVLEKEMSYSAGTKKDFPVCVKIPKVSEFESDMQDLIEQKNIINEQFIKHLGGMKNGGKLRWKLRVDMHCDGVDLSESERIRLTRPVENI